MNQLRESLSTSDGGLSSNGDQKETSKANNDTVEYLSDIASTGSNPKSNESVSVFEDHSTSRDLLSSKEEMIDEDYMNTWLSEKSNGEDGINLRLLQINIIQSQACSALCP